ncbi:MAG: hypothetical protein ABI318_19400 [Chthoniobacteraceae bacterium]
MDGVRKDATLSNPPTARRDDINRHDRTSKVRLAAVQVVPVRQRDCECLKAPRWAAAP